MIGDLKEKETCQILPLFLIEEQIKVLAENFKDYEQIVKEKLQNEKFNKKKEEIIEKITKFSENSYLENNFIILSNKLVRFYSENKCFPCCVSYNWSICSEKEQNKKANHLIYSLMCQNFHDFFKDLKSNAGNYSLSFEQTLQFVNDLHFWLKTDFCGLKQQMEQLENNQIFKKLKEKNKIVEKVKVRDIMLTAAVISNEIIKIVCRINEPIYRMYSLNLQIILFEGIKWQ